PSTFRSTQSIASWPMRCMRRTVSRPWCLAMSLSETRNFVETTPPLRPEAPQPISAASRMTGCRPRSMARNAALRPVYPPPTMAISASTAPESATEAGAGEAVSRQSDRGCARSAIGSNLPSSGGGLLLFDCVGELAQRGEVEIRLCHFARMRRAAIAFLVHPPLDPADLVAEGAGNADVMILALRDVQYVFLPIAESGLPPEIMREEARIGLGAFGVVHRDGVVEGVAQRVRVGTEGDAVGVRHRHEAEALAQPLERLGGILECRPAQHGELEGVGRTFVGGQ